MRKIPVATTSLSSMADICGPNLAALQIGIGATTDAINAKTQPVHVLTDSAKLLIMTTECGLKCFCAK